MSSYTACPCCSAKRRKPVAGQTQVFTCNSCGAVYGDCYLGDSYGIVLPRWETTNVPSESVRYFDFMCCGSAGITRRHGWYNPASKLIVQVG